MPYEVRAGKGGGLFDNASLSEQTLLGKSRWPIANAKGVRATRDVNSVSLTFERCVSASYSAGFELTNRVTTSLTPVRTEADLIPLP